jgi:hypothetical protein
MTALHGQSDDGPDYGIVVPFDFAIGFIVALGIREIRSHPAVDEVTLKDGSVVRHWKGCDERDCEWMLNEGERDA